MIDGLKLTFSGRELRTILDQRVRSHEERADRWTAETLRTADDQTEDEPLLPTHMCGNEAERHAWRAEVLAFIRDHIDAGETYRLGAVDLEFGELLPEKPGWVEQDEYEQRTRIGFNLERLVKAVNGLIGFGSPLLTRAESNCESATMQETVIDETDEFRTTWVDMVDGPEIVKIERK
jgi:hypothetical protein